MSLCVLKNRTLPIECSEYRPQLHERRPRTYVRPKTEHQRHERRLRPSVYSKTECHQPSALNTALSTTNAAHVPMSARRLNIANLSDTDAVHVPLCTPKPNAANRPP